MFDIFLTDEAREQLNRLEADKGLLKRYKAVKKASCFYLKIQDILDLRLMNSLHSKALTEKKYLRHMLNSLHLLHTESSGIMAPEVNR